MKHLLKKENLPRHVAIIMDGNGRWAKSQHLPRTQGHIEGMKRAEEIVDYAHKIGIQVITLYTFSIENWNRPSTEVSLLMNALSNVLKKKIDTFKKNNIKFQTIGRSERIPQPVMALIKKTTEETKENTGIILNLAFNYGSRTEIVDAVKNIAQTVKNNQQQIEDITIDTISRSLYTHNLPDPDLLIRTSGEKRISNFLLWQLSYTELYFTDKYWPDFTVEEFKKAIIDFQKRDRRFGTLTKSQTS